MTRLAKIIGTICGLLLSAGLYWVVGCAGKVPGNPVWTQPTATSWDYGFAVGPLLGRVVLTDNTYNAYGCSNNNQTGLATLEAAEAFVQQTCANANQTKK